MEQSMLGRVVLVTGGAKRVGAAIVRQLHAAGMRIAIHYHTSWAQAGGLCEELNALRADSAAIFQADLLNIESLPILLESVLQHFGQLDAIINNASSFYATPLTEINESQWIDLMGTNLKAPLFLARAAAGVLRERCGVIVNIADIHAERPMAGHVIYNIAKAGLVALTRSLAQELAPHVRVNAVAPGAIIWPEAEAWRDPVQRQQIVEHTLLKREGSPEDIATTVRFLLQDACYITGQVIAVDGGRSIHI